MQPVNPKTIYRGLTAIVALCGAAPLSPSVAVCGDPAKLDSVAGGSVSGPRTKDVSAELATVLKRFSVPGVSVAVVRKGRLLATGSAGVRQVGQRDPIRTEDRFHLGSCTKRMTSLMIYRLVDQGKLGLNSTLGATLKGMQMRDEYRAVTVRQLLEFKGGIQPYVLIDPSRTPEVFDDRGTVQEQRRRFVAHVLQETPVAVPGGKAVYSNADFAVLAWVATQVTGKSWETLMQEEVFRPLSMQSAGFGRPVAGASSKGPRGHLRSESGLQPEPLGFVHPASLSAAGDVSASMADFAKYALEELRIAKGASRLLSKGTSQTMSQVSGVAEGRTILGGAGAFTAGITLWPSLDFAVVVAVNSGGGEELCRQVSQAMKRSFVDGLRFSVQASRKPRGFGFGLTLVGSGDVAVQGVLPGSVAAASGLMDGDVILQMNGEPISKIADDRRFAALKGQVLKLTVRRKEKVLRIDMKAPTG